MFRAGNEQFSAGDECVENTRSNFSHTHTAIVPATFKQTLSYSPPSIRYTSTSYIYAIAFSARLNGLQVDQVDRENDKRLLLTHS